MSDSPVPSTARYGVHSEVGTLRKVMVCAPGRARSRLTPTNCDDLLFDDVMWVENAKRDHVDFIIKMRERGVDVVKMHDLLTETLADPAARSWILDQQIVANEVGLGLVNEIRSFLDSLSARELAETLIGGLSTLEVPESYGGEALKLVKQAAGITVYPRHHLLDLRRCHAEPAVLAGTPRRNLADHSDLSIPPQLWSG